MEGPDIHNGKDYWFSADALTPRQVAETLTAATGRSPQQQFRMPEVSQTMRCSPVQHLNQRTLREEDSSCLEQVEWTEEWRTLEASWTITKKILGRGLLLLRDWAKPHA